MALKCCPSAWNDLIVGVGFLGLLAAALGVYLEQFPEILRPQPAGEGALMEILITSLALLTLIVVVILIATGGKPMRFFSGLCRDVGTPEGQRKAFVHRGAVRSPGAGVSILFLRLTGHPGGGGAAHSVLPPPACRDQSHRLPVLPPLRRTQHLSGAAAGGKMPLLPQLYYRRAPGDPQGARLL